MLRQVAGLDIKELPSIIIRSGWFIPLFEVLTGVGLLFNRTRKLSSALLISMHGFLLIFSGNWLWHHNRIVIPWNAGSMMLLYVGIYKQPLPELHVNGIYNRMMVAFTIVLWAILPSLNMVGLWDSYLSMSLYSGKTTQMYVCTRKEDIPAEILKTLPPLKNSTKFCPDQWYFSIQKWALHETAVPAYPEKRSYNKVISNLKKRYPGWKFQTFCIEP
ncbi:MAG: hypothetical protein MUE71_03000 [Chitinophagaceae bacterium]|nr:hypothetical protein [Chitinophagaceae bacterium]